jgi:hypothetical protein
MFHITRSQDGTIASVAKQAQLGSEPMNDDHPELVGFFHGTPPSSFGDADAEFVRVLEDLIDTLIQNHVIRHTDLPVAAQEKLVLRKGMRNRMQGALNLLGGDGQVI